jgi:hypothetical protein
VLLSGRSRFRGTCVATRSIRRDFVKAAARIGSVLVILVLMTCALFTSPTVTSSRPARTGHALTVAAADDGRQADTHRDAPDGAVDLYGNEVIDAIATYSLDPAGSLYELHSPQTELPRLGSPKS